jgi:flagellar motor switch protein FliN
MDGPGCKVRVSHVANEFAHLASQEGNPMADDSEQIGQDEIEKLLQQAAGSAAAKPAPAQPKGNDISSLGQDEIEALLNAGANPAAAKARPAAATAAGRPAVSSPVPQSDIELLLSQAEAALASVTNPKDDMPPGVAQFQLHDFAGSPASTETATLELVRDVQLDMKIELGRTHMYLEDVLRLRKGAVVPLDKLAGDPVDIFVNGRLIARGEILVLNDNFCVRVAELLVGEAAVA